MQPLQITIQGNFWDSHLYKGRLYLWDMENVLRVYDWDAFISSLGRTKSKKHLPLQCAFSRGDLLYRASEFSLIFEDSDVRRLLQRKFELAAKKPWVIEETKLKEFQLGDEQESPVSELCDDAALYNDQLFCLTSSGLYVIGAHKNRNNKFMLDRKATKMWDGQGLSMQLAKGRMAIAAADDGMFECNMQETSAESNNENVLQVSARHTLFANYLFASIYGSSDLQPGYLAAYRWEPEPDDSEFLSAFEVTTQRRGHRYSQHGKLRRTFVGIVDEETIFPNSSPTHSMTFGSQEKLYKVNKDSIIAVNFVQSLAMSENQDDQAFSGLGTINFQEGNPLGEPMSGGVASFGLVTEFDSGLIIVLSDLSTYVIPETVTRWRIFPRSVCYENQLHVIDNNALHIYSFNQDYFVDQNSKQIGTRFKPKRPKYDETL